MRATGHGLTGSNVLSGRPVSRWLVVLAVLLALATSCRDDATSDRDLTGETLEVVGVWQDAEARSFGAVLDAFEDETGAAVTFTSTAGTDITAVLDARLTAGEPPDLAILPQPGVLERYVHAGAVHPIDDVVGAQVRADWAPVWQQLGTVDGRLYGLWFKAANKSLIWYSLDAFERAGVVPPDDLSGLVDVVDQLERSGVPAFSLAGAASDAWTLTDWFENLYLRLAGPERYDALAAHRLAWTHPSVREALEAMAALVRPGVVAGGDDVTFPESVAAVFSTRPAAAMVMEGDFVPGVLADPGAAEVGVDVDVFDFPGVTASDRHVVGGGDAAVLMRPSPAAAALLGHLASAEAAEIWAARGGFVSPNQAVDLRAYPDPVSRRIARSLLEAGSGFRFDLSDLQPVAFGSTTGAGLWAELAAFVADPTDVAGTMARLESAATEAWNGG